MGAARTTLATLNDVVAAGGKVPATLGGTGASTPSGARTNLGVQGANAVRGPGYGNVRLDPAGRVIVHAGLARGQSGGNPNVDGLNHNGFPSIGKTASGRLIAVYRRGTLHAENDNQALLVAKFSDDLGASWSAAVTIYQDPTGDVKDPAIFRATQGPTPNRLFITFYVGSLSGHNATPHLTYSDDHGQTWSSPVSIYDSARWGPDSSGSQVFQSPAVELANGNMLMAAYGNPTPATGALYVAIYRSTDHGNTWAFLSFVEQSADQGRHPQEPYLALLDDASVLCSIRFDDDNIVRFYKSTDSGATWTSPAAPLSTLPGCSRTAILQLATGAVVAATRGSPSAPAGYTSYPNKDHVFSTSRDRGVTWEVITKLDSRVLPNSAYSGLVEVAPGTCGCLYSAEYLPVAGNAELDFIYLLDGAAVSPLGGVVGSVVTAPNYAFGYAAPGWNAPVATTSGAILSALETNVNALLSYLTAVGLMPVSLKSLASCVGWWEPDFVPVTINDLTAGFGTDKTMTRNDGSTLAVSSETGTWAVSGGTIARSTSGGLAEQIVWDAGVSDLTVFADVVPQTTATPRIVVRRADASNYLYVNVPQASGMALDKVIAGVDTTLVTSGTFSAVANTAYTIKIILSGTTVSVYPYAQGGSPGTIGLTTTLTAPVLAALGTKAGFTESGTTATFDNLQFVYGLADGDKVGKLTDQTASALDLTQATTASKPTYRHLTDYFNEKPALLFNGTPNSLASASFSAKAQPNIIVGVWYFTATMPDVLINGTIGGSNRQNWLVDATQHVYLDAGSSIHATAALAYPTGPHVVTATFNGASSSIRLSGRTVLAGNAGTQTAVQWLLGDSGATSLFYYCGHCWLQGTTAIADAVLAERYFALKYGISLGA